MEQPGGGEVGVAIRAGVVHVLLCLPPIGLICRFHVLFKLKLSFRCVIQEWWPMFIADVD